MVYRDDEPHRSGKRYRTHPDFPGGGGGSAPTAEEASGGSVPVDPPAASPAIASEGLSIAALNMMQGRIVSVRPLKLPDPPDNAIAKLMRSIKRRLIGGDDPLLHDYLTITNYYASASPSDEERRLLYECRSLPEPLRAEQAADLLRFLAASGASTAHPPAEEDIATATVHMEAMSASLDESRAKLSEITRSAERIRDLLSLPL